MFSKLLIAISIILGAQANDSTISATFQNLEVKNVNKGFLEFRFSSATYFSDNNPNSKKCKVLTIYLSKFDQDKWENPALEYFNYSQYKQINDSNVRTNINMLNDMRYKNVMLEGGIKKIKNCYYLADAVTSRLYGDQSRSFIFGYKPVQSESPFWWKHES